MAKLITLITLITLIYILPLLCSSFNPDSPTDRRILVLVDDLALRSSHSIFFNSLRSRGYDLEFRLADDPKLALQRYGQYLYDGLVVFAPSVTRFGGSVDQAAVLDFVDAGRDLILAADPSASELIKGIAADCGVDFDEDSEAMVIDHIGYAVSDTEGDHTLIASDDFIKSDVILGEEKIAAPVLFRGIGHSINPANSLVLKVLSASPSAYSANQKTKLSSPPSLTGSAISLVSVVQARNNARILISGSLDLFSNRLLRSGVQKAGSPIKHGKSGNEQFVTEISKWVFHERGHLKAVNVNHHKAADAYRKVKAARLTFKGGDLATVKSIDKKKKKKKHKIKKTDAGEGGEPEESLPAEAEPEAEAEAEVENVYTIDAAKKMKYEDLFPVETRKFGYDQNNTAMSGARSVEEALDDRVKKKADRYCK